MKSTHLAPLLLVGLLAASQPSQRTLTVVYQNNDFQFTGVTVSKSGRIFLNFPRWSDQYLNAVVELMKDGTVRPYPDESWNRWNKKQETASKQFVCVQSVVADGQDNLWVIDPAAPLLSVVAPGGPKLVKIDLAGNRVARVYSFGSDIAKADSYLNDVRIDNARNTAYMTDSGAGGIVVLDLNSGKAHRALDGNPSVLPEPVAISVNGKPVVTANGKPPQIASDGIALSMDGSYLYYKALTAATLYRVKTSALRETGASVVPEKVAVTFPSDGLWIDGQDRLYIGDINQSSILRLDKNSTTLQKLVPTDSRLQWPDTFSQGPDGFMYITASHINDAPQFNNGKSARTEPYTLFKFNP
jgi:sugar lactone lactonase YvrE